MAIDFHVDGLNYLLRGKGKIRSTLIAIAEENSAKILQLDYIFVDKRKIRKINIQFLNHNYSTDIITFPYSEGNEIESEIYICIPVVMENAKRFGTSSYEELIRVIFHGLLHLVGYDDHSPEDAKEMRFQEDKWLEYFHQL